MNRKIGENTVRESIIHIKKQIFEKCKIRPENITNEAIAPIIEELKGFVV